jgi:hypothetical protein
MRGVVMSTTVFGVLVHSSETLLHYVIKDAIEHSRLHGGGWVTVIFNNMPISVHAGTTDETVGELCQSYRFSGVTRDWLKDKTEPS